MKNITPERFITVWQKAVSIDEAAKELGKPQEYLSSKAISYRKIGIPLKKFKRPTLKDRVKELSDLAKSLV